MTRRYEIVYIFEAGLDEAAVNTKLEAHHALLKTDGADAAPTVASVSHWGTRTLAYPIKNKETGYYVVADLHVAPVALAEFERALKLDESLLRHLLILNEGELPKQIGPDSDDDDDDDRDSDRRPRAREAS